MKRTNKGMQSRQRRDQPPAEFVEKRPPAEGNCVQTTVTGTQCGSTGQDVFFFLGDGNMNIIIFN